MRLIEHVFTLPFDDRRQPYVFTCSLSEGKYSIRPIDSINLQLTVRLGIVVWTVGNHFSSQMKSHGLTQSKWQNKYIGSARVRVHAIEFLLNFPQQICLKHNTGEDASTTFTGSLG
jgi:hypothetical protein